MWSKWSWVLATNRSGLLGQRLKVLADVAGAVAGVDSEGFVIALDEIGVVAVALNLPRPRGDQLRPVIGHVHRREGAVLSS